MKTEEEKLRGMLGSLVCLTTDLVGILKNGHTSNTENDAKMKAAALEVWNQEKDSYAQEALKGFIFKEG